MMKTFLVVLVFNDYNPLGLNIYFSITERRQECICSLLHENELSTKKAMK